MKYQDVVKKQYEKLPPGFREKFKNAKDLDIEFAVKCFDLSLDVEFESGKPKAKNIETSNILGILQ